jgi:hypothetical protein
MKSALMLKKLTLLLNLFVILNLYSQGISLISPTNNYNNAGFSVNFSWQPVINITSYRLTIASDSSFVTVLKDTVVNGSNAFILFSSSTVKVFWKVRTANTPVYVNSLVYSLNFISPLQNPNLLFWISADSNVVIQPVDSLLVSWSNILGNNNTATQSDVNKKPKLVRVPQLNDQYAFRFKFLCFM